MVDARLRTSIGSGDSADGGARNGVRKQIPTDFPGDGNTLWLVAAAVVSFIVLSVARVQRGGLRVCRGFMPMQRGIIRRK